MSEMILPCVEYGVLMSIVSIVWPSQDRRAVGDPATLQACGSDDDRDALITQAAHGVEELGRLSLRAAVARRVMSRRTSLDSAYQSR